MDKRLLLDKDWFNKNWNNEFVFGDKIIALNIDPRILVTIWSNISNEPVTNQIESAIVKIVENVNIDLIDDTELRYVTRQSNYGTYYDNETFSDDLDGYPINDGLSLEERPVDADLRIVEINQNPTGAKTEAASIPFEINRYLDVEGLEYEEYEDPTPVMMEQMNELKRQINFFKKRSGQIPIYEIPKEIKENVFGSGRYFDNLEKKVPNDFLVERSERFKFICYTTLLRWVILAIESVYRKFDNLRNGDNANYKKATTLAINTAVIPVMKQVKALAEEMQFQYFPITIEEYRKYYIEYCCRSLMIKKYYKMAASEEEMYRQSTLKYILTKNYTPKISDWLGQLQAQWVILESGIDLSEDLRKISDSIKNVNATLISQSDYYITSNLMQQMQYLIDIYKYQYSRLYHGEITVADLEYIDSPVLVFDETALDGMQFVDGSNVNDFLAKSITNAMSKFGALDLADIANVIGRVAKYMIIAIVFPNGKYPSSSDYDWNDIVSKLYELYENAAMAVGTPDLAQGYKDNFKFFLNLISQKIDEKENRVNVFGYNEQLRHIKFFSESLLQLLDEEKNTVSVEVAIKNLEELLKNLGKKKVAKPKRYTLSARNQSPIDFEVTVKANSYNVAGYEFTWYFSDDVKNKTLELAKITQASGRCKISYRPTESGYVFCEVSGVPAPSPYYGRSSNCSISIQSRCVRCGNLYDVYRNYIEPYECTWKYSPKLLEHGNHSEIDYSKIPTDYKDLFAITKDYLTMYYPFVITPNAREGAIAELRLTNSPVMSWLSYIQENFHLLEEGEGTDFDFGGRRSMNWKGNRLSLVINVAVTSFALVAIKESKFSNIYMELLELFSTKYLALLHDYVAPAYQKYKGTANYQKLELAVGRLLNAKIEDFGKEYRTIAKMLNLPNEIDPTKLSEVREKYREMSSKFNVDTKNASIEFIGCHSDRSTKPDDFFFSLGNLEYRPDGKWMKDLSNGANLSVYLETNNEEIIPAWFDERSIKSCILSYPSYPSSKQFLKEKYKKLRENLSNGTLVDRRDFLNFIIEISKSNLSFASDITSV